MALVYPLLRAFFMFLNILDTFKTLKLPLPSARNGGQPSTRALSQRKRNMKGCMTVWLIWCCLSLYERTLDGIVGMFIPFYSEVKSLVLLFFILTRARGAEPVFLHVLRPLIKPHVRTLDTLLDIGSSLGDFVSLVLKIPQEFIMAQYRHWTSPPVDDPLKEDSDLPSGSSSGDEHTSNTVPRVRTGTSQIPVSRVPGNSADRAQRAAIRSAFVVKPSSRTQDTASVKTNVTRRPIRSSQQPIPPPTHEIWHPPPSSYDSEDASPSGLPTPPSERTSVLNPGDDWRQYEPFPSAYPPTPLPSTSTLPTSAPVASPLHDIPETEESRQWRQYESFPSAYPATPLHTAVKLPTAPASLLPSGGNIVAGMPEEEEEEPSISAEDLADSFKSDDQHFRGSLQSLPELPNPGSDDDLSDEHNEIHGVQTTQSTSADEMSVDSEDEEEEDDFDVTLRTPPPPTSSHIYKSKAVPSVASTSTESIATRLSTTDNGSELRSRTNSQSSTLSLSSDESVIGRKRPLPKSLSREYMGNRTRHVETSSAGDTLKARSRQTFRPVLARTGTITARSTRKQSRDALTSTADEAVESDFSDGESVGVDTKRRRIGGSALDYTTRRIIAKSRGDLEQKVPRRMTSHAIESRRPPIPQTWVKKPQTDNPAVRGAAGKTAPDAKKAAVSSVGRTLRSLDKK